MSLRRTIVEVDVAGLNVAEFCRSHGISRWFFYDLRRRFEVEGESALEPRSRAPKTSPTRVGVETEDRIVGLRKRLAEQGMDAGAATIRWHLVQAGMNRVPSEATIWRILKRRGFITPDPKKAPKHSYRSFTCRWVNECWQIDDTRWLLADGTEVKIINIIDDCSRMLVASRAVSSCTTAAAFHSFCEAAERHGWPQGFLSDNAQAFKHGLADAVRTLGIVASHSRPYHPQTCGKIERVHQTQAKFLAARQQASNLEELQSHLDQFALIYNHQRPHRALGRRTPAQVFTTTPNVGPADRPINTPTSIGHPTVIAGAISVGSRYQIAVGNRWNGQQALTITTGPRCHIFIAGQLIRALTINPSRKYQPLHPRPGRPPTVTKP